MLVDKYHLPHNSIRIDEFNHMLFSINIEKDFYYYDELRLMFLKTQIKENKLSIFHPTYDKNLINHSNDEIRKIYQKS